MKKILMFVFNNLNNDARVQRSANTLAIDYDLTVVSSGEDLKFAHNYKSKVISVNIGINSIKYLIFVVKLVAFAVQNKKFDIIYAHDYFSALPANIIKLCRVAKIVIYDAHELSIPEKGYKLSNREKFFYSQEKKIIKKSSLIICAQKQRAKIMKDHYKLNESPVVIRNISYLPINKEPLNSEKQNICDLFFSIKAITIVYAGVLSRNRRIDHLINAVNNLGNNYKLIIIGDGEDFYRLDELIKQIKNKNIILFGNVPYNMLSIIITKCDIGYLTYPNIGINNIYCAPNKIFEYASAGLAIVAPYNPTIKSEIEKFSIGICDDNIEKSIKSISDNICFYKENLNKFIIMNSWDEEANNLKNYVAELIN